MWNGDQVDKLRLDMESNAAENFIPVETSEFLVRIFASTSGGLDPWFDKLFDLEKLFWNDLENVAKHICNLCTPMSRIVPRDLSITLWLEMLHQRESVTSNGEMCSTAEIARG